MNHPEVYWPMVIIAAVVFILFIYNLPWKWWQKIPLIVLLSLLILQQLLSVFG